MTNPEPDSAPVRPRKRPAPRPASNGKHPPERVDVDPRRLALTHALEDLHIAAKALELPAMRVAWEDADPELELTRDQQEQRLQVETMLADYEGARLGPVTWPLPEIAPPENPDAFLVGNLIRPGTTVMIAGPPGAAKSWAARQLGLVAAAGEPWFLERYGVDRPMSVLVVDEDNGPDEEWRREERLLVHLGLEREAMERYHRVSLEDVKLDVERWQRWLRGQIRTHAYDLVILDPTSEFHAGKELREEPGLRAFLSFLKRLKVDFPATATVLVHHTRKLDSKDRRATRGLEDVRGQWGQTPDVVVLMSPLGDRRVKWEVHKRVPFSSLVLEQIAEGEPGEGGLRMVADEAVMKHKAIENDDRVIEAVRDGMETFADIQAALGMPKSTLSRVLDRLVKADVIQKQGRRYTAEEEDDD